MKGIFQTYIEWIKGNRTVVYGIQCVVTLGLLICMSIQDIRKKQISLAVAGSGRILCGNGNY